jgi:hypothetical protein
MSGKGPTCIDCKCEVYSQSVRHHRRFLVTKDITFTCGARQTEIHDSESNIGRVEFEGCSCAL